MEKAELKNFIEQAIKDTAVHVKNSTERSNSDLVGMIMTKLETKIEESIDKNVNGKINKLLENQKTNHDIVQTYITEDMKWKEIDKIWKEDAKPSIDLGKNVSGFGKVSLYVVGFMSAVGGLFLMIKQFYNK